MSDSHLLWAGLPNKAHTADGSLAQTFGSEIMCGAMHDSRGYTTCTGCPGRECGWAVFVHRAACPFSKHKPQGTTSEITMPEGNCCAICGSHFYANIAEKSWSEAVKAGAILEELEDDEGYRHGFDPAIISKEDVKWMGNVGLVGINPTAKGCDQGFVTSNGFEDQFTVSASAGESSRHEDFVGQEWFACYESYNEETDNRVAFPVHPACYNLFRRRLAYQSGENGKATVKKSTLYHTLRELYPGTPDHESEHWGEPKPPESGQWMDEPGDEIFQADPEWPLPGLQEQIRRQLKEGYYDQAPATSCPDLGGKVKSDPFKKLPCEIMLEIAKGLSDSGDLVAWAKASWFAHATIRSAPLSFWKDMMAVQLAWFFELFDCVTEEQPDISSAEIQKLAHRLRAVYIWADTISKPRRWIDKGRFLRLANRRRIWRAPCAALVDFYRSECQRELCGSEWERLCSSEAKTWKRFTVTSDEGLSLFGDEQNFIFIEDWQDTAKPQVFEAFFRATDDWLVGLAITTKGREPRRIGATGDVDGVQVVGSVATVPAGDWIRGILLHIPAIAIVGTVSGDRKTSVKGVTIICQSGLTFHLGETTQGHAVRPLMARGPRQIIGLTIQAPLRTDQSHGPLPFTGIGLVTLWDSQLGHGDGDEDDDGQDNGIPPNGIVRLRSDEMTIDDILWSESGTRHFTEPYYNNHSLRFVGYDTRRAEREVAEVSDDLAAHEVLLWAKDAAELAQLKRISIFIAYSDEKDNTAFGMFDICGLGVEFVDGHPEESRLVGRMGRESGSMEQVGGTARKQPQMAKGSSDAIFTEMEGGRGNWRLDMDIDGPGGEFITRIAHYSGSCINWPTSAIKAARPGAGWIIDVTKIVSSHIGLHLRIRQAALCLGCLCDLTAGVEGTPMTHKSLTSIGGIAMQLGIGSEGMIPDDDSHYEDTRLYYYSSDEDDEGNGSDEEDGNEEDEHDDGEDDDDENDDE
ncbi:hypothetical protein PspLS_00137 [Pyricularia sp. CBS 133598]|nr:hypothetical protein PspLS_00137 [Pyricularia sp. CBS 133598]